MLRSMFFAWNLCFIASEGIYARSFSTTLQFFTSEQAVLCGPSLERIVDDA